MTSPIIGIPTTRVSDLFVRERVLKQTLYDQAELFRLQMQLSTGHRFELPSEDPVASARIIDLQRLLERKGQVKNNIATNQAYLNATDSVLGNASTLLIEARATVLGAMGTTASDAQRNAAAQQIDQTIVQMLNAGNQKFRGRYLFAGSETQNQPLAMSSGGYVKYSGNEQTVRSYADIDLLFDTNVTGNHAFGTLSEAVVGTADLSPVLTYNTRLADLRGGRGVSLGSIAVSDGVKTSIVDLTQAETIGDVAAMIRANPPPGRALTVEVTASKLVLQLDPAPGNLSVREVGGGTTAKDLGILCPAGVGNNPLESIDLDPRLQPTTPLADILGARAHGILRFVAPDNDIIVQADARGPEFNGVTIKLQDAPAVTVGSEVVVYDPVSATLTVLIDEGHTEAHHVVTAINNAQAAGTIDFTARLDPTDKPAGGRGFVDTTATAVTAGGDGIDFVPQPGIQIVNNGMTTTIALDEAQTIEDLLNDINRSEAGVLAEINDTGTGLNIRSRVSGSDFMIGENGGLVATDLGLRTFTETVRLDELNFGQTAELFTEDHPDIDFTIVAYDGTEIPVDVAGMEYIGDVLDYLNLQGAGKIEARLATYGNGIELVDLTVPVGEAAGVTIIREPTNQVAVALGLLTADQDKYESDAPVYTGRDVRPLETEGIFTSLVRLSHALRSDDQYTVNRALAMLETKTASMNFVRAEVGSRQQGLDMTGGRLDNEEIELRQVMSLEYDSDLVETISRLSARQASYEAALRSTARLFEMSLLNYI